jgi:formylglycine-generating enzyme required for sulfatase activity
MDWNEGGLKRGGDMKRFIAILGVFGFLVACTPSQQAVQTAAAETRSALPTSTPTLAPTITDTPIPTETPLPPTPTAIPTLGLGSTLGSENDGMLLVYVPEGAFIMGDSVIEAMAVCQTYKSNCQRGWFTNEEPAHTVYLDAYWIDQTEVTNEMYARCIASGTCDPPVSSESATRQDYFGDPQYDDFPVIYVTWEDAGAYCSWAGRRLPTEAEWEKAASWDPQNQVKFTYPWGNSPNDCNLSNFPDGSKFCVGDTTAVDAYPDGKSPYGALDMIGNVWEWVSDWYAPRYYWSLPDGVRNPAGPSSGEYRVVRGGDFEADSYTHAADRDFGEDGPAYFLGFRCARSP